MYFKELNEFLARGEIEHIGLFPHLDQLKDAPFIFNTNFGLPKLPSDSGMLMIRGPRQYGKSTWLENEIFQTIKEFGKSSAFYINGDYIPDQYVLEKEIHDLITVFPDTSGIKRLFIDEITAIKHWEMALKRLADRNQLKDTLIITTGSKATDLTRGAEKLPGRKGKLDRTTYLFTPISYSEFHRVCKNTLGDKIFYAYMISGGSPIACSELALRGTIPEFVIELTRDWIEGEITASGRSRSALLNIMNVLFRFGGTPVGQAKLARETGLANNTIAANYIELLNDLACVIPAYPWDKDRKINILRKPSKYHFTNLMAAITYHPKNIRHVNDFLSLSEAEQGIWHEWLVAQEILRCNAIQGKDLLMPFSFWQNSQHELDFVAEENHFIEVKRGKCSPIEFAWFKHQFPGKRLTVINSSSFNIGSIVGVTLEDFLLGCGGVG